jgi:hypothetical protein
MTTLTRVPLPRVWAAAATLFVASVFASRALSHRPTPWPAYWTASWACSPSGQRSCLVGAALESLGLIAPERGGRSAVLWPSARCSGSRLWCFHSSEPLPKESRQLASARSIVSP